MLLLQAVGAPAGGGAGSNSHKYSASPQHVSPGLAAQHSEPALGAARGGVHGAAGGGAANPAAAALRGKSWRDKEEQLQRLQVGGPLVVNLLGNAVEVIPRTIPQ